MKKQQPSASANKAWSPGTLVRALDDHALTYMKPSTATTGARSPKGTLAMVVSCRDRPTGRTRLQTWACVVLPGAELVWTHAGCGWVPAEWFT